MTSSPVLLEGGLVVDGSGGPSWPGDVLLVDGRIAAVGAGLRMRLPAGLLVEDLEVRDCRGLAIAPGFIDAHTHDDAIVLDTPAYLPKLSQGVTTRGHRQLRHLDRAVRDRRGAAAAQPARRRLVPLPDDARLSRRGDGGAAGASTWWRWSATPRCASPPSPT